MTIFDDLMKETSETITNEHVAMQEYVSRLAGRRLLWSELVHYMQQSAAQEAHSAEQLSAQLIELVQHLYQRDLVEIIEAVSVNAVSVNETGRPRCNRCGGTEQVYIRECATCNQLCATCEECLNQGRAKTCTPLIYFKPDILADRQGLLTRELDAERLIDRPGVSYSVAQQAALTSIERFMHSNRTHFLLWAVTGAGKTELCYPAISYALSRHHKILFAAPRKDVIRELATRFKRDFPNTRISALFAESEEKWQEADLYLATVQQTLRFYIFFDLVIIDELDAYPYHNNQHLQNFIDRAARQNAKRILMSATPPREWVRAVERRTIDFHLLPLRYHGCPLPVPKTFITKNYRNLIAKFIRQVSDCAGCGLIFVPQIAAIASWQCHLEDWFPEIKWVGVYAAADKRDEHVEQFRNGELQFLLTTTILERGVTFANLHVLVLDSANHIWDESTLVQIAGRVGRSADYPSGLVWFASPYLTKPMKAAIKQIKRMNNYAGKNPKPRLFASNH